MKQFNRKGEPTLHYCWQRKSDLGDFLSLFVPSAIYKMFDWVRHPKIEWSDWRHHRWAFKIRPGDTVCNCRCQHVVVVEKIDRETFIDNNGLQHSLISCCGPVLENNECHSAYLSKWSLPWVPGTGQEESRSNDPQTQ